MRVQTTRLFFLAVLTLALANSLGCSGDSAKSYPEPGVIEDGSTDPSEIISGDGFGVTLKSENVFPYYMQKGATFGSECKINTSTTTSEDISCTLDMNESDLYFHNFEFRANVPPEMCDYIATETMWFWNYSLGEGPTRILFNVTVDPTTEAESVTGCTATDSAGNTTPCATTPELSSTDSLFRSATCAYDYSASGGPNCCSGNYILEIQRDLDADTVTDETSTTNMNWNGNHASCFSGPGKTSWQHYTPDGLPGVRLESVDVAKGLISKLPLVSTISSLKVDFSTNANDFTSGTDLHKNESYVVGGTQRVPYAFSPMDDIDGTPIAAANPAYTFMCLDRGFEVKHRISIYIRDWNTYTQFLLFGTSSGASGDPNIVGTEGVNCADSGLFSTQCNDFFDFDDLAPASGTGYVTTPGMGANATRSTYFPRLKSN